MKIDSKTIEWLQTEANHSRNDDHQSGYRAGAEWASAAEFDELRSLYHLQTSDYGRSIGANQECVALGFVTAVMKLTQQARK